MATDQVPILEVTNLKKHFQVGGGKTLKAVDGISFKVNAGEVFGLVGESGCGKSTVGRTIVKLYQPTGGKVIFKGKNLNALQGDKLKKFRREMQMIFQDPYASLDPRMTVGDIIGEALDIHRLAKNSQRKERIEELLRQVGLNPEHASRFPHEFSGGQRQRIGVARALAVNPEFIIADEPISALDVSIQAQVVNLLKDLQEQKGLTYIFIAHDLAMVRHVADRVGVMYLGKLMELTTSPKLYANPLSPYTEALLSAVPLPDPQRERQRRRIMLKGDVPSPVDPPVGCRFAGRCRRAMDVCREVEPVLKPVGDENHLVACHLY